MIFHSETVQRDSVGVLCTVFAVVSPQMLSSTTCTGGFKIFMSNNCNREKGILQYWCSNIKYAFHTSFANNITAKLHNVDL